MDMMVSVNQDNFRAKHIIIILLLLITCIVASKDGYLIGLLASSKIGLLINYIYDTFLWHVLMLQN